MKPALVVCILFGAAVAPWLGRGKPPAVAMAGSIYAQEPQGDKFELRFRESTLAPGKHYYYVRLEQKDKHMAWSSPIWVNYNPTGK